MEGRISLFSLKTSAAVLFSSKKALGCVEIVDAKEEEYPRYVSDVRLCHGLAPSSTESFAKVRQNIFSFLNVQGQNILIPRSLETFGTIFVQRLKFVLGRSEMNCR
uniref:Uncharacterized protein n=1 Tax=Cacopsylla melanoneura TaxID=428564 RepID=A0A8D8VF81_9HEMI